MTWQLFAGIFIGWMIGLSGGYNEAVKAFSKFYRENNHDHSQ